MIAKLEFKLPEEKWEYEMANRSYEYHTSLREIDNHCRCVLKHGHDYKKVEELAKYIRSCVPCLEE